MFGLIKAAAIVSITTFVSIGVGVFRAKVTALTLGPSGIGILAQAFNFEQTMISLATLSVTVGLTKYIAEFNARGEAEKVRSILVTTYAMQAMASVVAVALVVATAPVLSRFLFNTPSYAPLLAIAAFGIPLAVFSSTAEASLFGLGAYPSYTKSRSSSALLSFIALAIFLVLFGLKGGFFSMVTTGIIGTVVSSRYLFRSMPACSKRGLSAIAIDGLKTFGGGLVKYGGASFVAGLFNMGTVVVMRSMLIRNFGADENGFYQVVFAISVQYLTFFTNGLWSYFYPKVSSLARGRAYGVELNHAIRFCLLGITPLIIAIYAFRAPFIAIVYSRAFAPAAHFFPTQLVGDIFFILYAIFSTSLLASEKLVAYLSSCLIYSALLISSYLLLEGPVGPTAVTAAYLSANIVLAVLLAVYHVRKMRFTFYLRNFRLLVVSILSILAAILIGGSGLSGLMIKSFLVVVWAVLVVRRSEFVKVRAIVLRKFGKRSIEEISR